MTAYQRMLVMLTAGVGLVATACSSEDLLPLNRIEFSDISSPRDTAVLKDGSITLAEGTAVSAKVTAIDTKDHNMGAVELESRDTSVIGVEPSVEQNTFVFYGVGEGSTEIDLLIVGKSRGEISVEVVAQSEISVGGEGGAGGE